MVGELPDEILRFFRSAGGHSLLVKGGPGSCKTMFALQLADELRDWFVPLYVSPRVSNDVLMRQFPSIAPPVLRVETPRSPATHPEPATCAFCGTPIDVQPTPPPIETTCPNCGRTNRFADRSELNRLVGWMKGNEAEREEVEKSVVVPDLHDLPEIETAYDVVDENLTKYPQLQTLLLIDSIDALDDGYDIRAWRLVNLLEKDLVENTGVSVVYVTEGGGQTKLGYLVDGMVSLSTRGSPNPLIRVLTIKKLRGAEVKRWKYVLMIRDGRLREANEDILDRLDRR